MKIYLTGRMTPETLYDIKLHETRDLAYKRWNDIRKQLMDRAKKLQNNEGEIELKRIGKQMEKQLSPDDPSKVDNWPWETPVLQEREVEMDESRTDSD